jgi:DNA-binding MarR family transcriptional regulator
MQPADPSVYEMKELLQRLFRLRHRFRMGLPEKIAGLKKRLSQHTHGNPVENSNYFDLFYNIGSILSVQAEPMAMGEISRRLNVPLSTATRIMDWLVSNDFAQRLPDPDDRRVVLVALTETGSRMYYEIDAFFMQRVDQLMHSFTPEESRTFQGLMDKMIKSLEQED